MHGGQAIVKTLETMGAKYIFSVSGGSISPIFDACIDSHIDIIHVRHESAAAFMADGWARATREVGVCAVTKGPGPTNALTGVATAYLSASPIVIIAGAVATNLSGRGAIQDIDQVAVLQRFTKWSRTVNDVDRISEVIAEACWRATNGRPGPTFVNVPMDIMRQDTQNTINAHAVSMARGPQGNPTSVKEAAALLQQAERPLVIAGSGVWWSGAVPELRELIKELNLPLFTNRLGVGSLAIKHSHNMGRSVISLNPVFRYAVRQCDLIMMIGSRFDYDLKYGSSEFFTQNPKTIRVDISPEVLWKNHRAEVPIIGDAKLMLPQLIKEIRKSPGRPNRKNWLQELRTRRQAYLGKRNEASSIDQTPIHPLRLCSEIEQFVDDSGTIVVGSGEIDFWGRSFFEAGSPSRFLRAGQMGCLGAEIPFAIATKLARPNERVVVLVGDGGFGYNCMEFDTASRYNIPITCVIGNDSAWGMIQHGQEHLYGADRVTGTDLKPRNYEEIVKILGGYGEEISRPEDIQPALQRCHDSGQPSCINVEIDSLPSPYLTWNWSMSNE